MILATCFIKSTISRLSDIFTRSQSIGGNTTKPPIPVAANVQLYNVTDELQTTSIDHHVGRQYTTCYFRWLPVPPAHEHNWKRTRNWSRFTRRPVDPLLEHTGWSEVLRPFLTDWFGSNAPSSGNINSQIPRITWSDFGNGDRMFSVEQPVFLLLWVNRSTVDVWGA